MRYNGYPGGVGIAEATYSTLRELLGATHAIIADCPCGEGCPSCVQSPKCGNNNAPLPFNFAHIRLSGSGTLTTIMVAERIISVASVY